MAELLLQCSGTAWAGTTGKHKQKVFPLLATLLALGKRAATLDTDLVQ